MKNNLIRLVLSSNCWRYGWPLFIYFIYVAGRIAGALKLEVTTSSFVSNENLAARGRDRGRVAEHEDLNVSPLCLCWKLGKLVVHCPSECICLYHLKG